MCGLPQACSHTHHAPPYPNRSSAAAYAATFAASSAGLPGKKPHSPDHTVTPYSAAVDLAALEPVADGVRGQRLGVDVRREHEVAVAGEPGRRRGPLPERRPHHVGLEEDDVREPAALALPARIAAMVRRVEAPEVRRGVVAEVGAEARLVEQVEAGDGAARGRSPAPAGPRSAPAGSGCRRCRRRSAATRPAPPARSRARRACRWTAPSVMVAQAGAPSQPLLGLVPGRAGLAGPGVDVHPPGVLVHVQHDVQAELPGPAHRAPDLGDVRRVVGASGRLQPGPAHQQPHGVEPQPGDAAEVVAGLRRDRRVRRVGLVVLHEPVDVDPAQQHLRAPVVADRGARAGRGVQDPLGSPPLNHFATAYVVMRSAPVGSCGRASRSPVYSSTQPPTEGGSNRSCSSMPSTRAIAIFADHAATLHHRHGGRRVPAARFGGFGQAIALAFADALVIASTGPTGSPTPSPAAPRRCARRHRCRLRRSWRIARCPSASCVRSPRTSPRWSTSPGSAARHSRADRSQTRSRPRPVNFFGAVQIAQYASRLMTPTGLDRRHPRHPPRRQPRPAGVRRSKAALNNATRILMDSPPKASSHQTR